MESIYLDHVDALAVDSRQSMTGLHIENIGVYI